MGTGSRVSIHPSLLFYFMITTSIYRYFRRVAISAVQRLSEESPTITSSLILQAMASLQPQPLGVTLQGLPQLDMMCVIAVMRLTFVHRSSSLAEFQYRGCSFQSLIKEVDKLMQFPQPLPRFRLERSVNRLVQLGLLFITNGFGGRGFQRSMGSSETPLLDATTLYLSVSVEELQLSFHPSPSNGPVLKLPERVRKAVLEPMTVLTMQSFHTSSSLL